MLLITGCGLNKVKLMNRNKKQFEWIVPTYPIQCRQTLKRVKVLNRNISSYILAKEADYYDTYICLATSCKEG